MDYGMPPSMKAPTAPITAMPKEILQLILDPSMIIERIRHDLKGETLKFGMFKDEESGEMLPRTWWESDGQRDLNDMGVEAVVSLLNKYINRNTIFTQLSEEEIYKITKTIDRNLTAMFAAKYEEYEIDLNRMSMTKDAIVDMCFFALKQSQNKALMEALTQLVTVSEVKDSSKQSFQLSDLSPFGRNK